MQACQFLASFFSYSSATEKCIFYPTLNTQVIT
jgi:hypothetical protein